MWAILTSVVYPIYIYIVSLDIVPLIKSPHLTGGDNHPTENVVSRGTIGLLETYARRPSAPPVRSGGRAVLTAAASYRPAVRTALRAGRGTRRLESPIYGGLETTRAYDWAPRNLRAPPEGSAFVWRQGRAYSRS